MREKGFSEKTKTRLSIIILLGISFLMFMPYLYGPKIVQHTRILWLEDFFSMQGLYDVPPGADSKIWREISLGVEDSGIEECSVALRIHFSLFTGIYMY